MFWGISLLWGWTVFVHATAPALPSFPSSGETRSKVDTGDSFRIGETTAYSKHSFEISKQEKLLTEGRHLDVAVNSNRALSSCSAGQYDDDSGSCKSCPPGRFSTGDKNSVISLTNKRFCSFCPPGRFGTGGSTNAQCSGTCAIGRFGSRGGETTDQCEGPCLNSPAGSSYCGCAPGKFGSIIEYHSSSCENCASGRFGRGGSRNDQCTGACPGAVAGASLCGTEMSVANASGLVSAINTANGDPTTYYWVALTQDVQLTGEMGSYAGLNIDGAKISLVGRTVNARTLVRRDSGGDYIIFSIRGSAQVYLENLLIVNGYVHTF